MTFEQSPVGESASNGKAERRVQVVEDLLRTLKAALQGRLKAKIPMAHPIMKWLIEHTASILNRFVVGDDGQTAYQRLHGRRANKKAAEFAEKVLYYVPRRLRTKMMLRWRVGLYLGVADHSGEHWIGVWNGDVVRSRSVVRVVEGARWKTD